MAVKNKLVDELLKDIDPKAAFSPEGPLAEIKKALAERMLNAELDQHLESEAVAAASGGAPGNHRNGYSKKKVTTDTSQIELEVRRDRRGTFARELPGVRIFRTMLRCSTTAPGRLIADCPATFGRTWACFAAVLAPVAPRIGQRPSSVRLLSATIDGPSPAIHVGRSIDDRCGRTGRAVEQTP